MKERYYTVPNLISFYRFLSALFIFSALFVEVSKWIILLVYIIAIISDKLDGIVARRLNQESKFGEILETFVDTILTGIILVYVMVKFNFPFLIFLILFTFFIIGLVISTIYFIVKKDWFSKSLKASKVSVLATYSACLIYFFDISIKYYFALIALLIAVVAFLNFFVQIMKYMFKKERKV